MSGAIIPLIFLAVVVVIGFQTFKVVPQQEAYIVER